MNESCREAVLGLGQKMCALLSEAINHDGGTQSDEKHTPDQEALVDLAQEAQKTGVSEEEAEALLDWASEVGLSGRGPESHPNRPFGRKPHIHVGPINHIPIIK